MGFRFIQKSSALFHLPDPKEREGPDQNASTFWGSRITGASHVWGGGWWNRRLLVDDLVARQTFLGWFYVLGQVSSFTQPLCFSARRSDSTYLLSKAVTLKNRMCLLRLWGLWGSRVGDQRLHSENCWGFW
jgi:hypothetical protein